MSEPVTVTIPHQLGQTEAKVRIGKGVQVLSEIVPGATISDQHWDGDSMNCTIEAMGQRIGCKMQVREDEVYGVLDLPPMLTMFANKIKEKIREEAPKMLE